MFAPLPDGPFDLIYADPPWRFNDQGTRASPEYAGTQRPDSHYEVITLDHICSLPVQDVCAQDAWLFLWIPTALRESSYSVTWPGQMFPLKGVGYHRAVAEAWGFDLVGAEVVWVKGRVDEKKGLRIHIGMGHYTRNAHEVCLIAKRGNPVRAAGIPSVLLEGRTQHSAKPGGMYGLIEKFCTGRKLELFARDRRDGWTAWGEEV